MAIEKIQGKRGTIFRAVSCSHRKRVSRSFKRLTEAKLWLEQQEKKIRLGYQKRLGFTEAALKWFENHSLMRKAPSSQRGDRHMINQSLIPFFGNRDVEEIKPEDIDAYIATLKRKGVCNATANKYLQVLRAILNHYVKRRVLLFNAVSIAGLLPQDETAFDYLSCEEADQFLTYASEKYVGERRWIYVLYLTALNTGLRWGEIIGLKWDRVDVNRKLIVVSRSYCKESKQIRETTKGRKIRHVGINSCLMPELKALKESRASLDAVVFQNKSGNILDRENFLRRNYEPDLKASGLRVIRFHDLRHTFASHFMMKGGNLYDLQKLMGHSQISTTERYAHLSPESLVAKTELVAIGGGKNNVVDLSSYSRIRR